MARRPRPLRAIVSALTLLATLLRLTTAAIMPLAALAPSPQPTVADAYQRFVAEFGPDAVICAAMPGPAGQYRPPRDGPESPRLPDCAVCPLCATIRDAASATLLSPSPTLPTPIAHAKLAEPIPDDAALARPAHPSARARAPPVQIPRVS